MQRVLAGIMTAVCVSTAHANLIANPGNESALIAGNIPGWTEVVGDSWARRLSNPTPFEGGAYFFAGAVGNATLRQLVDVSSFSATIDASVQEFDFTARVRSFDQTNPDSSRIVLTYLGADSSVLATFDSGEIRNTIDWQLVEDSRVAPVLTRSIRIDLVAKRYAGDNNDGYFDALSLVAAPVPEPAAYLMMSLGLALLATRARARKAGS